MKNIKSILIKMLSFVLIFTTSTIHTADLNSLFRKKNKKAAKRSRSTPPEEVKPTQQVSDQIRSGTMVDSLRSKSAPPEESTTTDLSSAQKTTPQKPNSALLDKITAFPKPSEEDCEVANFTETEAPAINTERATAISPWKPISPITPSPIPVTQNEEERLRPQSPHESQFQGPATFISRGENHKGIIIPNEHDIYSCGAATTKMALNMLIKKGILTEDQNKTFEELVDILEIKKYKSSYTSDIISFFKNLELTCIVTSRPSQETLETIITNCLETPTIVLTYAHNEESNIGHFVLLRSSNEDKTTVQVCDPWIRKSPGLDHIPRRKFEKTCEKTIQITGKIKPKKSPLAQKPIKLPPKPSNSNVFMALGSDCED